MRKLLPHMPGPGIGGLLGGDASTVRASSKEFFNEAVRELRLRELLVALRRELRRPYFSLGELTLFSGVFEVGDLIIGSHNYYFPAFFLKLANITVAEFRAPFESCWVIAFYVIERPVGMKSRHILAELVNMAFYDYARLRLRCIRFGSFGLGRLRVIEG